MPPRRIDTSSQRPQLSLQSLHHGDHQQHHQQQQVIDLTDTTDDQPLHPVPQHVRRAAQDVSLHHSHTIAGRSTAESSLRRSIPTARISVTHRPPPPIPDRSIRAVAADEALALRLQLDEYDAVSSMDLSHHTHETHSNRASLRAQRLHRFTDEHEAIQYPTTTAASNLVSTTSPRRDAMRASDHRYGAVRNAPHVPGELELVEPNFLPNEWSMDMSHGRPHNRRRRNVLAGASLQTRHGSRSISRNRHCRNHEWTSGASSANISDAELRELGILYNSNDGRDFHVDMFRGVADDYGHAQYGVATNPANYVSDASFDGSYESLTALGERLGNVKDQKRGVTADILRILPRKQFRRDKDMISPSSTTPASRRGKADGGGLQNDSEESQCAVCLTEFEQGEILMGVPCLHWFHVECLTKWLDQASICPICRLEVKDQV